jgi:hypothetical protein
MALTFSLNIKNLFHASDLHDLHLAADALLRSSAFLLGALQIIISEHSGIAAGADFIGHVHGSFPLDELAIAITLWLPSAKLIQKNQVASEADSECDKKNINHVSYSLLIIVKLV